MRRNQLVVVAAALQMVTNGGSPMQVGDPIAAAEAEAEVVAEVTRKLSSHWERCRSGVEAWGAEEGKAEDSPSL